MEASRRLQAGRILLGVSLLTLLISILAFVVLYFADNGGGVNDVRITNVTANGATISWTTDNLAIGRVYYSTDDTWTPFLDRSGKALAIDDRDVVQNHEGMYTIKQEGSQQRYTHHVTLRNLSPETTYYFRVGENLRLFAGEEDSFTTVTVSENVAVPDPVYGAVYEADSLNAPADGIVYYRIYTVNGENEVTTQEFSSALSETGTWTGDLGNNDTTVNGVNLKDQAGVNMWVEAKTELGATRYSFPLEDYKPLPNIYVREGFDPDGSSDAKEGSTALDDNSLLGDVLSAVSSPVQAASACSEDYYEACEGGGQKLCHKRGESPDGQGGPQCSWGAGSYCEPCSGGANPAPSNPAPAQPAPATNNCLASGCSRAEGQVWIGGSSGLCRICRNGCTQAAPDTTACCSLMGPNDSRRAQNGCPVNNPQPQPVAPPQEPAPGSTLVPNGGACTARDGVIECQSGICCACGSEARVPGQCYATQAACNLACSGSGVSPVSPGNQNECPEGSNKVARNVGCYSADVFCPGSTIVQNLSDTNRNCVYRKGTNFFTYTVPQTDVYACFPRQAIQDASNRCKADQPDPSTADTNNYCRDGFTNTITNLSTCVSAESWCPGSTLTSHGVMGSATCQYTVGNQSFEYVVYPSDDGDPAKSCLSNSVVTEQTKCRTAAREVQGNGPGEGPSVELPLPAVFDPNSCNSITDNSRYCPEIACEGQVPVRGSIVTDPTNVEGVGCIYYGGGSTTGSGKLNFNGSCDSFSLDRGSAFINNTTSINELVNTQCGSSSQAEPETNYAVNVLGAATAAQKVEPGVYTVTGNGFSESRITITEENVSVIFFIDSNGDGIRQETEQVADGSFEVRLNKTEDVETFEINQGWNLIGLPVTGPTFNTASKLLNLITDQGVNASHVAMFSNNSWSIYSLRSTETGEESEFGEDFNIVPGAGLFIKSDNKSAFSLTGNGFAESVPVNLTRGWNLISVQSEAEYTAGSFITACENADMSCDTVSRYEAGRYESVIKDAGTLFGIDFNLITTRGYFVRVDEGQGGQLTP